MSTRRNRLIHLLKLTLFTLTPAAVLLIAAETFATMQIKRWAENTTDETTHRGLYVMNIGRFPWGRRSETELNSQGFPDVEFASVGEKGDCLHVVFVGDSFTFGDGVDDDENFVSLFRDWTESHLKSRCIRVFNLGERTTTIDVQSRNLRSNMEALKPDVVILAQYENDLTDLTKVKSTETEGTEATRGGWTDVRQRMRYVNLNIVRLLSYHAFAIAIQNDFHQDLLKQWSILADPARQATAQQLMTIYEREFNSIATELADKNIEFGTIIIPSKFDILAGRYPEEDFFVRMAQQHQLPYLRLFPVFDEARKPYAFLMYDGHFNETGHQVVAEQLERWIYESHPAPFARLGGEMAASVSETSP